MPWTRKPLLILRLTRRLRAGGQARKDPPAHRDENKLDGWIVEFILDAGLD